MEIDFDALLSNFRNAEEGKTFEAKDVSGYVMSRIWEPLQRDGTLLYENLDFSLFGVDDITNLMDCLDDAVSVSYDLKQLNQIFCQAEPASVACRAFC